MAESRFSLFGTPTPEQVRSKIMGQQRQEALQMAAMPAGRGMVALGHQAGSGLGGLLSQAMGGDPYGEKAARAQQEVMQGIMSNAMEVGQGDWAATYEAAIDGLMKAGLHDRAFEAMNELRDIQNIEAQIAERTASADRSYAQTELDERDLQRKEVADEFDRQYRTTRLGQLSRRLDQFDRQLDLAESTEARIRTQQKRANVLYEMADEYMSAISQEYGVDSIDQIEDTQARMRELERARQFIGTMDGVGAAIFSSVFGDLSPSSTPRDQGSVDTQDLKVGDVEDGFVYLGGDPSDPDSWRETR